MDNDPNLHRYKRENGNLIMEIAVKNSRQLFNERDPAPFRERDLDPQFVTYLVSCVQEFALRTKIVIRILTNDEIDINSENIMTIQEAIRTYFQYESHLAKARLRKHLRTARYFFLIGIFVLFVCVSIAEFLRTLTLGPAITEITSIGFIIIGWVAMWHPLEAMLYDWWPIREHRLYFEKISNLPVEVQYVRT